jgi:hypothetical protein
MITQAQKDKWVQTLTSGNYKQGHGILKNRLDGYCCLGVFLQENFGTVYPFTGTDKSSYGWLHEKLSYDTVNALIRMNDTEKKDFTFIAEWIEDNVKVAA